MPHAYAMLLLEHQRSINVGAHTSHNQKQQVEETVPPTVSSFTNGGLKGVQDSRRDVNHAAYSRQRRLEIIVTQ